MFPAFLGVLFLAAGSAGAQAASPEEGQRLFEQSCTSCHTIGGGDAVGPDLAGVTGRRERDWLIRFIVAPDEVIASGDPIAAELLAKYNDLAMPNLGLTEDQAGSLVVFFEAKSGETEEEEAVPPQQPPETAPPPEAAPIAAPVEGDAASGKNLFTGADRLENGGPPCMSCHSVAGIGALGGGKLGPDLTPAYEKYGGAQGLTSVLANVAFPTMRPIYADQRLAAREQADLVAFLSEATQAERPAGAAGRLVLLSFGAAGMLVAFGLVVWRSRLTSVRRLLVSRSSPRRK